MTEQETLFTEIGLRLQAEKSQMFGKACFKVGGKAFICLFRDEMVFKLGTPAHVQAMALPGARLFDPSGKNRPMKEWVQLPYEHSNMWEDFAGDAMAYVKQKVI